MRFTHLILSAVLFIASCSASQKTTNSSQNADLAFAQKDYKTAYEQYTQIIDNCNLKKQAVSPELLAKAGKCLFYMDDTQKAVDMLSQAEAKGFSDSQSLYMRIKYYGDIDNLSKEIGLLEKYSETYPQGEEIDFVNTRMFLRYVEMAEYDNAAIKYAVMSDARKNEVPNMEKYHTVCTKLGKDDEAQKVAEAIYKIDPSNVTGLNAVAYQAYITTENEYVAAIKAYESKKTQAAYSAMVQKTTPLVARFKKARDLYLKLYAITKKPHDAAILSRIYTRLNDKSKADYYSRLSKQ